MAETLECEIVTPEMRLFSSTATFVALPAADGEMGVLPKHVPLVGILDTGEVRITLESGEVERFAVFGGYVQVQSDSKVIVLADRAVKVDEIDSEALSTELDRINANLESAEKGSPTETYLIKEREWAVARQKLTGRQVK